MMRTTLLLAIVSLVTGGCSYCDSPHDYCGPLFGGSYDPYGPDGGSFHRVESAFSGLTAHGGYAGPAMGPLPVPNDDYYDPNQPPPPTPGPSDDQMFRASLDAEFSAIDGEEHGYGPLLLRQDADDNDNVAAHDS